ncbi:MAG: hypothetical protein IJ635_04995 [Bacteroidaceae bacterium]|nr:hypothetical protein [Prevotella sp.]MBR1520575.1 hypothetical protein [Bacteroidaceae bacterium]
MARIRRKLSEATKFKMSMAKKGKKGKPHSETTKRKIAMSMVKYWHGIPK